MGLKAKVAAVLAVSLAVTVGAGPGSASGSGAGSVARAVLGNPTAIRLQKGTPFHGDLRNLPSGKPKQRERPEPELPAKLPPLNGQAAPIGSGLAPGPLAPAPSPSGSFDGLNFVNNGSGWPPDPNGDVGPSYYIQVVNTSIGIYDKSTHAQVVAVTFDTFMSGHFPSGNLCNNANAGDPIVVYDTFHDRWVITDLAFQTNGNGTIDSSTGSYECIAVSRSGDPVNGGWNFYSLHLADGIQDYPKFGVWPDGLYMSANMFNFNLNQYLGPRVWALDLAGMEAGTNATAVPFDISTSYSSLLPANARLQTGTPPLSSPNYYVSLSDSGSVEIWKFHVDWATPADSTFTGPSVASEPAWLDPPASAAEPSGNVIDTIGDRAMMQNQYTNIGSHESLWDTRTVQGSSASQAAVAWFQTDVSGGTVASSTTQASTWNPDSKNRFLPSLAVDRLGDMAIGYSVSSSTADPAIRYAARLAGDPLNTLSLTETSLIDGTGWQWSFLTSRWGDYSTMTLDPADGCTFWYTNEYYASNGDSWLTRIGSFALPGCTGPAPPTASDEATATKEGTAVPITLQGSSSSVCELGFSIVSGPAHGTLGSIADHPCTSGSPNMDTATVNYTPDSGYTGSDLFTYKVNDGTSDSNAATVTLAVNAATGYPATILADSPAAYWRLDESSGSSMADSSGNGLAGSYVGGPTLGAPGVVSGDSAVPFNGSSQYAQVAYKAALNPASSFSVEAWAKLSGGSGYRSVITSRGHYTGYVIYAASNGHWQFWLGTGSNWYVLNGPAVATNVWTYLVATYDGTSAKLYVNGTLAASGTPANYAPNTSNPLRLAAGATEGSPTFYFPGSLDETAIYPTSLTPTQIQTHYGTAIPPQTIIDAGPPSVTNSTSASFSFHADQTGSSFQCSLDGAPFSVCTSPAGYSGLATGNHTFQVEATNPGGSTDPTPASWAWTITSGSTPTYDQIVLGDSPAAYWRLDESSGSSMADSSGNGLAGSYVGGPTLGAPGVVSGDSAVPFNGSSQYAQVAYKAALNPASSFSVEAWAKLSGGSGYRSVITSRGHYTGYVIYAASNGHWQFWLGTGSNWYVLNGPAVATNVWTYLVATYDGASAKLYVNGTLAAGGTPANYAPNTSNSLRLAAGATEGSPTFYFPGSLDETAIYPTSLTATQIQTHNIAASS